MPSGEKKGVVDERAAAAETFMKILKCEEFYLWDYQSLEDVKRRILFSPGSLQSEATTFGSH
jgi:hypothetical protein